MKIFTLFTAFTLLLPTDVAAQAPKPKPTPLSQSKAAAIQKKSKPAAPPAAQAKVEPIATKPEPAPSNLPAATTAANIPIRIPQEILQVLEERMIFLKEIERINTSVGAVQIPTPGRELQQRAEKKNTQFLEWLDSKKIPREWQQAGWTLDPSGTLFIPPTATPPADKKEKP